MLVPTQSFKMEMQDRLQRREWSKDAVLSALKGERIPDALGFLQLRLAVFRGIRHHPGFAEELYGVLPEFSRALNARKIMSNHVPDSMSSEDTPYCIWYPDISSEDTYRLLVHRYPHTKYHVARACAVAGYTKLYQELDVLPDVHVAEEARHNGHTAIFDLIMSAPKRYSIMNDYSRVIHQGDPQTANLNCDTALRSSLDVKRRYREPENPSYGLFDFDDEVEDVYPSELVDYFETLANGGSWEKGIYFNLTEDWGIDDIPPEYYLPKDPIESHAGPLLYSPLPVDLPEINKDVLILMAAYNGDIDRYSRLRRPHMIKVEEKCVLHGLYHHPLFAKWWDTFNEGFKAHINARYIMSNDLTHISDKTPEEEIPLIIWSPTLAVPTTYRRLAKIRPDMMPQIARSCILAGYTSLFEQFISKSKIEPTQLLLAQAKASTDPFFYEQVKKLAIERGLEWKEDDLPRVSDLEGLKSSSGSDPHAFKTFNADCITPVWNDIGTYVYFGDQVDVTSMELSLLLNPDNMTTEDSEWYYQYMHYDSEFAEEEGNGEQNVTDIKEEEKSRLQ